MHGQGCAAGRAGETAIRGAWCPAEKKWETQAENFRRDNPGIPTQKTTRGSRVSNWTLLGTPSNHLEDPELQNATRHRGWALTPAVFSFLAGPEIRGGARRIPTGAKRNARAWPSCQRGGQLVWLKFCRYPVPPGNKKGAPLVRGRLGGFGT